MTKTEARTKGTEQGQGFANGLTQESLVLDQDAIREGIRQAANSAAVSQAGFRSVDSELAKVYIAAFCQAAYTQAWARRDQVPEIVAARRIRSIAYSIEQLITGGEDELADFAKRLAENPLYAFESSDRAITAAARRDVGLRLKQVFDHETGGPEAAVAYAIEQAVQGARWPSHSTSAMSNFCAECKVAAYGDFAATLGKLGR